ncbi:uncharacterized protein LOC106355088 [Brassica napus]|uniref:uncharacterized protein LOC106355088 n=1 Tax=Brassica napus TaxID=3708 RepID=UPI0006AB03BF|nr:uncharacterized protein LOC106355088 [Brassica napus]
MHTFFHCKFVKKVWNKVPLHKVVHLATSADFKEAIFAFKKSIFLPPSGISGSILPWVCWALWTACNTLIFEDRTLTHQEVATKSLRLAREWNYAQNHKEIKNRALPGRSIGREPPAPNQGAIYKSDAAWDKSTNKGGLGWIISDRSGSIIKQGSTTQPFINSLIVAEALALRLGLIAAVNIDLTSIKMIFDNSTLIIAINKDMHAKEIYGIVQDIQQISSVFVDISFSLIFPDFTSRKLIC